MAHRDRTRRELELELESARRALDAERERAERLKEALDSERASARAQRAEAAAEARATREREAAERAAMAEQLKMRSELALREAVEAERTSVTRALSSRHQRDLTAARDELKRDAERRLAALRSQLGEALKRAGGEPVARRETDALVRSLRAEHERTLRRLKDEWKRDTDAQVEALNNQLKELQRLYMETSEKLTTTTNEAETAPKLRQEIQNLKTANKELEERVQVLMEGERKRVEELRVANEQHKERTDEIQRAARRETLRLLEEIKSKSRTITQLQRDRRSPAKRPCDSPVSPLPGAQKISLVADNLSGEPSRICVKRPKSLTFASDLNKRQRALEGRKPPDPPDGQECAKMERTTGNLETSAMINNNWTKTVGIETLYQLLLVEHQELQLSHHQAITRLRDLEQTRLQLEERLRDCQRPDGDNGINLALAEQIQALQERQAELESEAQELREQNDLLEFRILELDDGVCAHSCGSSFHSKSPTSRSPDTRDRELDDISDSGVMSLPTSEDISESDFQDLKMAEPPYQDHRDVKSRLAGLCQSLESVADRIVAQQALALLRHYDTRIDSLEATLTECQLKSSEHQPPSTEHAKSPSRIIATVLPFTEPSASARGSRQASEEPPKPMRERDCMQESGIFEETVCITFDAGTQTEWGEPIPIPVSVAPPGDLGAEIRKLTRIRERIEEKGGATREAEFLPASAKDLLFYRERARALEDKVAVYESDGDERTRLLAARLDREAMLAARADRLQTELRRAKDTIRTLEEEKCEFEEAENDTRLRCQKLEVKLSALGEKKSDLQVQLQQNARTMSNLRSTLSEEERKRTEARQYAAKMEALANRLEQQNFEIEEREMEIRYRLHSLENVVPAMVMYYLWRLLNSIRPYIKYEPGSLAINVSSSDSVLAVKPTTLKPICKRLRNNSIQRSAETQEYLQVSLIAIEHFLSLRQKGEHPEVPEINVDVAFLVIEELSEKCRLMGERIKELELKEKVYRETLQNGDHLLSKMDSDYKQQIRVLEDELFQKQTDLNKAESLMRKYSGNRNLEIQLQERINQLETELSEQYVVCAQKEKDRKVLEGENTRLTKEIEDAIDEIDRYKENVEKPLREDLELQKRKVRDLLGDLDLWEQEKEESDDMHHKLVKELKKINNQACRQLEESEVTISELKEEVVTLEREVGDLRAALGAERDRRERLMISVGAELEAARERQLLAGGVTDPSPAGSLREELLRAESEEGEGADEWAGERVIDLGSNAHAPGPAEDDAQARVVPSCDCQCAEQLLEDFDIIKGQDLLDDIVSAYQHSRTCRKCKSSTTVELRRILNILQKTAPHSKMAQINHLLLLR